MLARMMGGPASGGQLELAGRAQFDCYYKSYLDQIREIQQQQQQQVVGQSFRNEMNAGQRPEGKATRRRRQPIERPDSDTSSGKWSGRVERPASEQPINLSGPPASPAHTASNTPLLGNSSSSLSCDPSGHLHQATQKLSLSLSQNQNQDQHQFARLHNLSAVASALSWSTGNQQQADQQQFIAAHHQHQLMLAAATAAAAMASQQQQQRPKHHLTPASNRYSRQQRRATTCTTTPAASDASQTQLQYFEPPLEMLQAETLAKPPPLQQPPQQPSSSGGSGGSAGSAGSGGRRRRGSRKCRKIYGMAQRQLWCTQCKWKKACSRFCCGSANGPSIASIGDHLKLLAGLN